MVEAYLPHLPKKFLRQVAGFTSDEGGYFLPRAQAAPPPELLEKIWPWVEEWEERFRQRSMRKTWDEGGLDEDDVAGQGFLAVLRHLRVVLLQDLAVLQPDYPDLPFFQHEVFSMPSWASYSEVVRAAVLDPDYSRSLLLEQVLPEVSHAVYSTRDSLHYQAQHLHAALNVQLAALVKQMNNVAAIATSFSNLTSGGQRELTIQFGTLPPLLSPPVFPASSSLFPLSSLLPQLPAFPANLSHLAGHPPSDMRGASSRQEAPNNTRPDAAAALRAAAEGQDGRGVASQPLLSLSDPLPAVPLFSSGAALPASPPPPARPPAFRLLALHTMGDLWRAWKEGMGGQPAVEALEESWGKDWRREGRVGKWFSARKPLIEKVDSWISRGCTVEAAVELVERERGCRSLDKFYKDYVRQKNGGVVVPRKRGAGGVA